MKKITFIVIVLCLIGLAAGVIYLKIRRHEIRHIVLISIDTCRADHLSCYGYPRNTTPHIDALADNATRFEQVISPVPITLPAHSSMLTGTIPPSHGVHNNIDYRLTPSAETLAETLIKNEFRTGAIVSTFVLNRNRGLNQGFETYNDEFNTTKETRFGNERRGDETTQLALKWLDHNKHNKFFLFLHYYDPHKEYDPPEPFASKFPDNPYAGEISYADHCIGQVIQKLKNLDLFDSTLLIITSDHGEMLGEHGEEGHSYFIYESAIRVPLIVKIPRQKEGMIVSQPVGLVDLVPTIYSLLGIDIPKGLQGKDISAFLHSHVSGDYERFIYSESTEPARLGASALLSVHTGRWKYIQTTRPELYDISYDPEEIYNLIESEPHRARILEDKLRLTLSSSTRNNPDSQILLDPESIRRLKSLGYIAGRVQEDMEFDRSKKDPKDLIGFFVQYQRALELIDNKQDKPAKDLIESLIPQQPLFHELYVVLGDIALRQSDYAYAIENYRKALEVKPDFPISLNNLAWMLATRPSFATKDPGEAVRLAEKLCELSNFANPRELDTLAVAYAAAGDFQKAIKTANEALSIAQSYGNEELIPEISIRLALFEKSEPYIEEQR